MLEQIGSPREIYERPATAFVADFVGVLNAMEIPIDEVRDQAAVMRIDDGQRIEVPVTTGTVVGGHVTAAVRPERVRVGPPGAGQDNGSGSRVQGQVALVIYLGTLTQIHVDTALGTRLIAHRLSNESARDLHEGEKVVAAWDRDDASVLGEV